MGEFLKKLVSVDEAIERLKNNIRLSLDVVNAKLDDALGLISSNDIYAPYSLPYFNKSVVDGYAVRAEDTYGASHTNPIELRVVGSIDIGSSPENLPELEPFTAVEISTGAPLPKGANAVIMYEDTERISNDRILVYRPVAKWANVARIGEDFEASQKILGKGEVIQAWHIAALASYGFSSIKVFRRLRIAVIPIGSELIEPEEPKPPLPGKIYEGTSYLISSYLRNRKYVSVTRVEPLPDDEAKIRSVISDLMINHDIIITVGGSSIGRKDLVVKTLTSLPNSKLVFRGVAIRPGRPASAVIINGKPVFVLSGFPVAALAALDLIFIPTIKKVLNIKEIEEPYIKAKLVRRLVNVTGYTSYARVKVFKCGNEVCAEPLRITGSGVLSTLIRGNGVVIIPPDVEGYEAGEIVNVRLVNPLDLY
ncbi:MAG: molybdopterin molybdenumtransferase MoeA [Desulfurococcales archaeon ex4484_42]|nr:MAG: molybdopterin molybdenumtransferase MoeA [Desulfurococcales archaeon ex4484_42]